MTINNMHLLLISLCTRKNKITDHKQIPCLEKALFPLFTWPTYFGGLAGRKPGNIRICIFHAYSMESICHQATILMS